MPQASNNRLFVIFLDKDSAGILDDSPLGNSGYICYPLLDGLVVECRYEGHSKYRLYDWLTKKGFCRFFENYWEQNDLIENQRSDFMEIFFSHIAPEYEAIIHISNNIACYDSLLMDVLKSTGLRGTTTLDYGCGTGLILKSCHAHMLDDIVGFDFSYKMRGLARTRKMKVLSPNEFELLGKNTFNIVILNYVLHLGLSVDILNKLLNLLKKNSVIIGNVHKDINLSQLKHWVSMLDKSKYVHCIYNSKFGSIIRITKLF